MTTFQSSVILPDWCLRGIFYDVPGEFSNMLFCVFFISPRALAFRGILLVLSDFILVIDLYTFLYFWDFLCLYYSKGSSLLLFPSLGLYTFLCFPLSWWEHFYQMELESQLLAGYFFSFYLPVLSSLFSGMRLSVRVCIVGWSILSKVNSFLVISVFCKSFILSCIIPKPYVTTRTAKVFYASILLADFDSFFGIVLTLL